MLLFLVLNFKTLHYSSNNFVHPISFCFPTKSPMSNQQDLEECLVPGGCSEILDSAGPMRNGRILILERLGYST